MGDRSQKLIPDNGDNRRSNVMGADCSGVTEMLYKDSLSLLRHAQEREKLSSISGWSEYGDRPWIAFALQEGVFVAGGNSHQEVHEKLIATVRTLLLESEEDNAAAYSEMLLEKAAEELVAGQFSIVKTTPGDDPADALLD